MAKMPRFGHFWGFEGIGPKDIFREWIWGHWNTQSEYQWESWIFN